MDVYREFGKEYRRLYARSAEMALIRSGSRSAVEEQVGERVGAISRAVDGTDVNIAYLALCHVLEYHFMFPMAGR